MGPGLPLARQPTGRNLPQDGKGPERAEPGCNARLGPTRRMCAPGEGSLHRNFANPTNPKLKREGTLPGPGLLKAPVSHFGHAAGSSWVWGGLL